MNKRILSVLTAIILFLQLITVYADAVFGNEFRYENEDKVISIRERGYGSKRFVVNSSRGYVTPKEEPGSDKEIPTIYGYRKNHSGAFSGTEVLDYDVYTLL